VNRFTLDTVIEDEGGNLSVGQVRSFSPTLEVEHSGLTFSFLYRTAIPRFVGSGAGEECKGYHSG
jgi:hypothetical protein